MNYNKKNILRFISIHNISLVSFDIFDTLIMRKLSRPIDVFQEVADNSEINTRLTLSPYEYAQYRIEAEYFARKKTSKQDVCFNNIFSIYSFNEHLVKKLKKTEIEIETKKSFINHQILDVIALLINMDVKVILISDMYFSSSNIRNIFFNGNELLTSLPLYSSCDYGLTKYSGDLYQLVSKKEEVDYSNWLHVGDNLYSDIKAAQTLGINVFAYGYIEYFNKVSMIEYSKYQLKAKFQAVRRIASTVDSNIDVEEQFFSLGSFIWGPVLLSFADWVIDTLLKLDIKNLVCIMREGELFSNVINQRLNQRGIDNIDVKIFYASRQSTFFASIDINNSNWIENLINSTFERRGYCLKHFLMDYDIESDDVLSEFLKKEMPDLSSIPIAQGSLINYLKSKVEARKNFLESRIKDQRKILQRFFKQSINKDISDCALLDLGGGGTILYQIEKALGKHSGINLLFYSTQRIYRYINSTSFSSFLGSAQKNNEVSIKLNRSFESIEPLLIGDKGSTLCYVTQNDEVKPVLGSPVRQNNYIVKSFVSGVKSFIDNFHQYGFHSIKPDFALKILMRFLNYPTRFEAMLFTKLFHQDNFGIENIFPVISPEEINLVKKITPDKLWKIINHSPNSYKNSITWPEAVLSYIDEDLFFRLSGISLNRNTENVDLLIAKIVSIGWDSFSVYGAGAFFENLLIEINKYGLNIECVIDRKAETSPFFYCGFRVTSLDKALEYGSRRFVIASFAFKKEIITLIHQRAIYYQCSEEIEVISI